jgi:predicted ATPase
LITRVSMYRFKQFDGHTVNLTAGGVTLLAGGNNSGKSSLLHALAVWEFCRTASMMERGADSLLAESVHKQGFGLGDEEFSPIPVPSLKHLWTNLKTQKTEAEPDGYTLRIGCHWTLDDGCERELEFGLSLANDRLFVKTTASNLKADEPMPTVAYLPPFAGISAHEERTRGAIRRRRIGEGLAGAVLRNLLLDMHQENSIERRRLRGDKSKISDPDLRRLRETDPWELLSGTLREVFGAELDVDDFREEYHSYINVKISKGTVNGFKLKRFPNYTPRDLMVEGSGFLQWLSVYTLATTPGLTTLLFDEPDAHLHPTLQNQLMDQLESLAVASGKQVLLATHSSEIIRNSDPRQILNVSRGGLRYLSEEGQKIALLSGMGSDYSPKIERARSTGKLLFVEGMSDLKVLKAVAKTIGVEWPTAWVEWRSSTGHKERKQLFIAFSEEFQQPLTVLSLRDRDDESLETVGPGLEDKVVPDDGLFHTRKWRRRYIESYLVCPRALAAASGLELSEVEARLRDEHGLAVGTTFTAAHAPQALMDVRAKEVFHSFHVSAPDVASSLTVEEVCDDLKTLIQELVSLAGS